LRLWGRYAVALRRLRSRASISNGAAVHRGYTGELPNRECSTYASQLSGDTKRHCHGDQHAVDDGVPDGNITYFTVANACATAFADTNAEESSNGPGRHLRLRL
jgi:hypothetical protein